MVKDASLIELKNYFDLPTVEFMKEWKKLDEKERKELKQELGKILHKDSE